MNTRNIVGLVKKTLKEKGCEIINTDIDMFDRPMIYFKAPGRQTEFHSNYHIVIGEDKDYEKYKKARLNPLYR